MRLRILAYSMMIVSSILLSANAGTVERIECEDTAWLKQKIGSMIVVGFVGNHVKDNWFTHVADQLHNGQISGVLYFGRNIRDLKSVKAMNRYLHAKAAKGFAPIIAIDQEGGKIQRLTARIGFPDTPSAHKIAGSMNVEQAEKTYAKMASSLAKLGFTLNLGPVVDLNLNRRNPIIGRLQRSYSQDPKIVVKYAAAFIKAHRANGIVTALKHFPGHGSSLGDTHKQFVDVSKTWSPKELEPFSALIANDQVDLIMTAHIRNGKLQTAEDVHPVSLSEQVIENELRRKMKFGGVIISDDLQMKAVSENYKFDDALVKSVMAGNDLLLLANDKTQELRLPQRVAQILAAAACRNPQLKSRIVAASLRIGALRKKMTKN